MTDPPTAPDAATGSAIPSAQDRTAICSAKGCRAEGVWALVWNNPRLHAPDRRKIWLACDDHRDHLTTFLAARSFLLEVVPRSSIDPGADLGAGESGG